MKSFHSRHLETFRSLVVATADTGGFATGRAWTKCNRGSNFPIAVDPLSIVFSTPSRRWSPCRIAKETLLRIAEVCNPGVDPDRRNARVLTKGTPSCLLLPPLRVSLPPSVDLCPLLCGCETTVRWFWCLVSRPAIYLTNRPSTAVISSFLGFSPT